MSEQAVVSQPPQEPPKDLPVVSKEERIEYRDETGRILQNDRVSRLILELENDVLNRVAH